MAIMTIFRKKEKAPAKFLVGDIYSKPYPDSFSDDVYIYDAFDSQGKWDGQKNWARAIGKKARLNERYANLLKKAYDAGFVLTPNLDIPCKVKTDKGLAALMYLDNTIYRKIFASKHEALRFANLIGVYRRFALSKDNLDALKNALADAVPHELGHVLWKHLSPEQKEEWEDIVLHPDTDIEPISDKNPNSLLAKRYKDSPEELNSESFCSHLNAYVCPDARNLSGAKPNALVEQFFKEHFGLN